MNTIIKADVFFFVTTIVVTVVGIFLTIALIYAIRSLRRIDSLSMRAKETGDKIIDDIDGFRDVIKSEGFRLGYIGSFLAKFFASSLGIKKRKGKN